MVEGNLLVTGAAGAYEGQDRATSKPSCCGERGGPVPRMRPHVRRIGPRPGTCAAWRRGGVWANFLDFSPSRRYVDGVPRSKLGLHSPARPC